MELESRIKAIQERWFLTEPAFFGVICLNTIEIREDIKVPICCGRGHIYVSSEAFDDKGDKYLEQAVKVEALRVLLRHPYQRQLPDKARMYVASNMLIANNMELDEYKLKTTKEYFGKFTYDGECYEGIYKALKNESQQTMAAAQGGGSESMGGGADCDPLNDLDCGCRSTEDAVERTRFWQEDDYYNEAIKSLIGKFGGNSHGWGSIPGGIVETIKGSLAPRFNYKIVFEKFRGNILSSSRNLTRMKPNRRYGYKYMGSRRNFTTSMLVAVDTSGSISSDDLKGALGFINGFFKYGMSRIDCIAFDTSVYKDSLCSIRRPLPMMDFKGRGGTDFNGVFDYVLDGDGKCRGYNGVIILTDGEAPVPDPKFINKMGSRAKFLWCLNSKGAYDGFVRKDGFRKFGEATYVDMSEREK